MSNYNEAQASEPARPAPAPMPLRLPLALSAALLVGALAAPPALAQSAEAVVVREAIAEYQRTGRARVLEVGQTILVPYGQVDPVLKTALLRTTLIELGPNEWVVDRFMGDTLRWDVDFGTVGTEQSFRQIVSVKPTDQDLTTSLILTTNVGRIYQLTLDSEPYPGIQRTQNPTDIPYTAHVKFYYPDEPQAALGGVMTAAGLAAGAFGDPNAEPLRTAAYVIEADEGFPCPPVSAGDNGTHLRLVFPDHTESLACAQRFPLYAVDDEGALNLLNYAVEGGNTYVADRVPAEARVLYRTDSGALRQVRIRNTSVSRWRGPRGVEVGLGIGAALPSGGGAFQRTYAPGLDLALSGGLRATRSLTVGVEAGYRALGANAAFVGGAVEFALNEALAPALRRQLAGSGAIGADESVVLFSRGARSEVTTTRLSAFGRLSLAPEGRVDPYLGVRVGVLRRSATPATFQASGLVVGADGVRRQSPALTEALAASFAGRGGAASLGSAEAEAFAALLRGEFGSEYELPAWVAGETDPATGLDLGASFGLAVRATRSVRVYVEGEYAYAPTGTRPDRALIPLHIGARVGF